MTTIVRNTYPVVVRNTSGKPFLFVNAKTRVGDDWSKTYKLIRGKECYIKPEDFIVLEPELNRLVAAGQVEILQQIVEEDVSQYIPSEPFTRNIPPTPEAKGWVDWDERKTIKKFFSRISDPGAGEAYNNSMWFVDRRTGHTPIKDIDFRFQINDRVYSVFDVYSNIPVGTTVAIDALAWTPLVIDGEDYWYVDLWHFMDALYIMAQIWKGTDQISVHRLVNMTPDMARIYVPADPDLRFAGAATFIKIST